MAEPETDNSAGDSIADAKDAFPDCPAGGTVSCPASSKTPPPARRVVQCVKEIKATVGGTNGVRKVGGKVPERSANTLRSSTSSDKSLMKGENENFSVLVRGCKDVLLEAVTSPPDTPVTWKVEANHTANSPPAIAPDGVKAVLKTDVDGSFSVIATLGGCKVVWNVIFVWVQVDIKSTKSPKPTNFYVDGGSSKTQVRFRSGEFSAGKYAWEDKLTVKLIGGGDDQKMGVNRVTLHVLQNCLKDTLIGHYAPPPAVSTALEKPKGGVPILDSTNEHSTFLTDTDTATVTSNSDVDFEVWTGDSPAADLLTQHQFTSKPLQSISGGYKFETAIVSVSRDAPNAIVAHACTTWSADYSGIVDGSGNYVARGAKTTPLSPWALISETTGGEDAGEAHMETFEPRFNDTLLGSDYDWTPSQ